MLSHLTPTRFDRRMNSGRTIPSLLACSTEAGDEIEVIAKVSAGCDRGVTGLALEAIGAMLAADLDLPVPEPFLVDLDADFCHLIHDDEVAANVHRSVNPAFASKKLPPGFTTVVQSKSIPKALVGQAAEIFAFDALIQNPDRRPTNPNCLSDGHSFAIIDHELAFMTEGLIGWKPPWQAGSLEMLNSPTQHIFYTGLKGEIYDFDRFAAAWVKLSDDRLNAYSTALPAGWRAASGAIQETLAYISQIRQNVLPALAEVSRVLK